MCFFLVWFAYGLGLLGHRGGVPSIFMRFMLVLERNDVTAKFRVKHLVAEKDQHIFDELENQQLSNQTIHPLSAFCKSLASN